jgi:hypothetical protein
MARHPAACTLAGKTGDRVVRHAQPLINGCENVRPFLTVMPMTIASTKNLFVS